LTPGKKFNTQVGSFSLLSKRDNTLPAIRQRYGMAVLKAARQNDYTVVDALRDIPTLLRELDIMTPKADEHGRVTIENEELKEQVKELEGVIAGLRYELRMLEYVDACRG